MGHLSFGLATCLAVHSRDSFPQSIFARAVRDPTSSGEGWREAIGWMSRLGPSAVLNSLSTARSSTYGCPGPAPLNGNSSGLGSERGHLRSTRSEMVSPSRFRIRRPGPSPSVPWLRSTSPWPPDRSPPTATSSTATWNSSSTHARSTARWPMGRSCDSCGSSRQRLVSLSSPCRREVARRRRSCGCRRAVRRSLSQRGRSRPGVLAMGS